MGSSRQLVFPAGTPPQRLDQFLSDVLEGHSRSQVQRLIDEGLVLLEGKAVRPGVRLRGGEKLQVTFQEAVPTSVQPEPIPLHILYEDSHLVVVDKPAGLVVHPAAGHATGTLVNALLHHCDDLSGVGGELRPGIVHRLDKDTSGILVAAKNDVAHRHLAAQFKAHTVERKYTALVYGLLKGDEGSIDRPIGRHPVDRKRMSSLARRGRHAVTHWQVLQRFASRGLSLLELTLETGRTHQIRVHLSEQNLPLVGDPVYGRKGRAGNIADTCIRAAVQGLNRQFLHAHVLGFEHPVSGEILRFSSPLPVELQQVLDILNDA